MMIDVGFCLVALAMVCLAAAKHLQSWRGARVARDLARSALPNPQSTIPSPKSLLPPPIVDWGFGTGDLGFVEGQTQRAGAGGPRNPFLRGGAEVAPAKREILRKFLAANPGLLRRA